MAITWERLAGDTSKFAIKMSLLDDPDGGLGATEDESSSWGSFQIWVDERNLSSHQYSGEVLESTHWYLLPFLEWWVSNWDSLFHEERLPTQNAAADAETSLQRTREAPMGVSDDRVQVWNQEWYDWWARHCIEAARAGGIFPSICLRRWRDTLEISWGAFEGHARRLGLQFIHASGNYRLPPDDVAAAVHSILSEAASQLVSRRPQSERLRALAARIGELASPREDRLAWLLGLGTTLAEMRESLSSVRQAVKNMPDRAREAIFGTPEQAALIVKPFPAALMFGAVSPHLGSNDRIALMTHLADAYGGPATRVDELAAEELVDSDHPWSQGYDLAEQVLDNLQLDDTSQERVDIESILRDLGVDIRDVRLQDRSIRAVAIGGAHYRATILLNRNHQTSSYPTGRRFSLAHELCHLLYDRGFSREIALPSGPWAPRDVERRANAFAAMLLMPPGRIRQIVDSSGGQPLSRDTVLQVSSRLQTSFTATVEHMFNLGLVTEEERDMLLEEAVDRSTRD